MSSEEEMDFGNEQDWEGSDSDGSLADELEALRAIEREEQGLSGDEGDVVERILNVDGIQSKLDEISLPADWHWIETMEVVPSMPLIIEDVNQDLAREVKFYELTLLGVKEAVARLKNLNVPFIRPGDYYADMVKPPHQMDKIKDSILNSQRRKEAVEERKRRKEQMKYAKQLKSHQAKQKVQQKMENILAAKDLAKKTGHQNKELKVPRLNAPSGPSGGPQGGRSGVPQPSKKRKAKDDRYGYGGKKKLIKTNDGSSASDFSGFNIHKNNSAGFGKTASASRRKPSNKGAAAQRPGKSRRASVRQ